MTCTLLGLLALISPASAAELGILRVKKVTANIYRGPRPDQRDFEEMARAGVAVALYRILYQGCSCERARRRAREGRPPDLDARSHGVRAFRVSQLR